MNGSICRSNPNYAARARHRLVVEEMFEDARRGFPSHVLYLARLGAALVVTVSLGGVVVVTCLPFPRTDDLRIERPVRNVDAVDGVDEGAGFQSSWSEPLARVPSSDQIADRDWNLEWQ